MNALSPTRARDEMKSSVLVLCACVATVATVVAADAAPSAEVDFNCTKSIDAYYKLATGSTAFDFAGIPYVYLLCILAFMMGMGKGGVPGSSTTSVAVNALSSAKAGTGCSDISVGMGVPITLISDVYVSSSYYEHARWDVIQGLLPPVGVGMAIGYQLLGKLSKTQSQLLIGCVLSLILALSFLQPLLVPAKPAGAAAKGGKKGRSKSPGPKKTAAQAAADGVPAYATSVWFVSVVGVVGGFATILTNSMGPMLNVYLLTLQLDVSAFVATRSTFFCFINIVKVRRPPLPFAGAGAACCC